MISQYDKAFVALVMAAIGVWNIVMPGNKIGLTQDQVSMLVGLATPALVYLVPNKAKE